MLVLQGICNATNALQAYAHIVRSQSPEAQTYAPVSITVLSPFPRTPHSKTEHPHDLQSPSLENVLTADLYTGPRRKLQFWNHLITCKCFPVPKKTGSMLPHLEESIKRALKWLFDHQYRHQSSPQICKAQRAQTHWRMS